MARESKPERNSFEIMVKVEKDLAKQNLGEKYCRCGKYTLPRKFQKNIYFCFIDDAKAFGCVDHNKLENS